MNPYLPGFEYVPDGEPHIFGDRVYLYGSHDRFDGSQFCMNDYVCWSAPVDDLSSWRYEGVIYKKEQDPRNQNIPNDAPRSTSMFGIPARRKDSLLPNGMHSMFAPDVVQGKDGRFYLYYCLDFLPEVGVAVCDSPAGAYEFLGFVKHPDGEVLGKKEGDHYQFDPGVFMDVDGTVYLYSGNAPITLQQDPDWILMSQVMTLEDDMVTLKSEPKRLLCDLRDSAGTGFEGHEFFEASSIRRINGKYYFIYSSVQGHELCYAVSEKPDEGYVFGGTIVDICNIGINDIDYEHAQNPSGNTHGGLEYIHDQWYIFYHRQTNRSNFSRQACAEPVYFDENGRIAQVEVTSSGMLKHLSMIGSYPAYICSELNRNGFGGESQMISCQMDFPFLTQDADDTEPTEENIHLDQLTPFQYICNIQDGTCAGYKYFDSEREDELKLTMTVRQCMYDIHPLMNEEDARLFAKTMGMADNEAFIEQVVSKAASCTDPKKAVEPDGNFIVLINGVESGKINVSGMNHDWKEISGTVKVPQGKCRIRFVYEGRGILDFLKFELK